MVRNGDVTLAARDWGEPGASAPDLVLMHGLGNSQRAMAKVASRLSGWRVITMDLRGHGRSTTASWDFPSAISDVDAVVAAFHLESPYVGGHSLGGMVALQYALAGRPVAGVINIDGWGPGVASRYLGEDQALVKTRLERLAAGDLSSRPAQALTAISRQAREGTTRQVLALLDRADLVAWHGRLECPVLAFNAIAPAGRVVTRLMGREEARLQNSHREGLRRDLAAVAKQRPNLTVVEIQASHQLIATHPALVAAAITAFHEHRS